MPDEPNLPDPRAGSVPPPVSTGEAESAENAEKDEIGEFITRQVLDRGTVFFEG